MDVARKKTQEEFIEDVEKKFGEEYVILGEYTGASSEVLVRRSICRHEYKIKPNHLLSGSKCKKCPSKTRRKSHEEYVAEAYAINPELKVIGEYVNFTTKIEHECKCGKRWETTPSVVLNGQGLCYKCGRDMGADSKTKSTEEYKEEVLDIVGNEFSVIGEYEKGNLKIEFKHNKCGHLFKVKPSGFLIHPRCPKCPKKRGNRTWTHGTVKEFIEQDSESGCVLISDSYINGNASIEIKCKCKEVFSTSFHRFKDRNLQTCDTCRKRKRNENYCRNIEELNDKINSIFGDMFYLVGEFTQMNEKHIFYCNIHQRTFEKIPNTMFRNKTHCPYCGRERTAKALGITHNEFLERFYSVQSETEYKILTEYSGYLNHLEVLHIKCGNEWRTSPSSLIRGGGCPKCSQSTGEVLIDNILEELGLEYIKQYADERCKDKKKLRFDFAIYYKDSLRLLIEFDGKQHFSAGWGEKKYRDTVKKDNIKNNFSIQENIPLLRIPFWLKQDVYYIINHVLFSLDIISNSNNVYENYDEYVVSKEWNHRHYIMQSYAFLTKREKSNILVDMEEENV